MLSEAQGTLVTIRQGDDGHWGVLILSALALNTNQSPELRDEQTESDCDNCSQCHMMMMMIMMMIVMMIILTRVPSSNMNRLRVTATTAASVISR